MNETYESIISLRALREYEAQPVSEEDLNALLEAGRQTGSSKNRQNWSFIVIDDRAVLDALSDAGDFTVARDILGLPEGVRCRFAITVGYPTPTAGPTKMGGRKPMETLVHHNTYGS
jgi:hypothetical protein